MRAIPIKNITLLNELELYTRFILKRPYTFNPVGRDFPDLTFATLEKHKADSDFKGLPKEMNMESRNYKWETSYTGMNINVLQKYNVWKPLIKGPTQHRRTNLIRGFREWIPGAENQHWYYDTIGVQPAYAGFQGWSNSKNLPRHSVRFIWNEGAGFSRGVAGGRYTYIPDQKNIAGSKNWTCITNSFDEQGETWFADRNLGRHPRVVIDISIPTRYHARYKEALYYIQSY